MKNTLFKIFIAFSLILGFTNLSVLKAQNAAITSISPNNANLGQSLSVTISGQNTHFAQGTGTTTSVWFSQGSKTIVPSYTAPQGSISISAYFHISSNESTGLWNVNASNNIDGLMTLPNSFMINQASNTKIISVNPNSAHLGQTLSVNITAQNTNFGQGSSTTTAWFEQGSSTYIPINNINVISSTQISGQVTIPSNISLGSYNTWTSNSIDGQLTKANSFTVNSGGGGPSIPLSLTSLNPNWGELNKKYTYTLVGHLTHFSDPSLVLAFKHHTNTTLIILATNVNVINDSLVKFDAKINLGTNTDTWDFYAYSTIDGSLSLINAYAVSPVSISTNDKNFNVDIFPNPSNSIINIRSSEITNTNVEIIIHNSVGKLLYSKNLDVTTNLNQSIDISSFPIGVYFIQIKFDNKSIYKKLLKN